MIPFSIPKETRNKKEKDKRENRREKSVVECSRQVHTYTRCTAPVATFKIPPTRYSRLLIRNRGKHRGLLLQSDEERIEWRLLLCSLLGNLTAGSKRKARGYYKENESRLQFSCRACGVPRQQRDFFSITTSILKI